MRYQPFFLLAVSAVLLPGAALAQPVSGYRYQRTAVGPAGAYTEQRSGAVVPGPFGAVAGTTRSGSYVAPSGATLEYAERSGAVVGPLGGVRGGSTSYLHAESADRGKTYSRYSSSTTVGPVPGMAASRVAAIGPFGSSAVVLPGAPVQPASGYRYERTTVGPGGEYSEQGSGGVVAGPFGAVAGATRSGSYVAPSGATVEYSERSGAVVGPLGGVQGGSTSYLHAESADRGKTYSRYSSSTTVGPAAGVVGYRRSMGVVWP